MKALLMQRVSESARRLEANYMMWILSVASIILFILTVDAFTITDLQPFGFYYFRSLPAYYWAGVSASVLSIVLSFAYDSRDKNHLRIIPVLLLGLFLYGTPVFTYDAPRFADIYAHGSEALPIISGGHLNQNDRYASEYPSTFVLLGMSSVLQNVDPLTLIRFTELFTILVVITLIYCIVGVTNSRFAAIAPLSFMGAFWVDQGHFSPQGLALIFYLVFFLSLLKAIASNDSRRGWLAVALIMLLVINFTSPTNSLFLILNLGTIATVSVIALRKRSAVSNRMIVFTALAGVIFLSWSIYNAESRTILKAGEFEERLAEDFGSENIKVTPSPSESYYLVNTLRMVVVGFVLISGAAISFALLRKKQRGGHLLILIGWFATACFILISMYLSPVLLSRNFMYVSIPWAVLATALFTRGFSGRKDKILKVAYLSIVVILVFSIPATRYGRDPTTYASSSLVNSVDTLASASDGGERVISYFIGGLVTRYFAAQNGIDLEVFSFERVFQSAYLEKNANVTKDWLDSQSVFNSRVIFSDPEKNNVAMKFNQPEAYQDLEESVQDNHNLIINNGSTRVYSTPSTIAYPN